MYGIFFRWFRGPYTGWLLVLEFLESFLKIYTFHLDCRLIWYVIYGIFFRWFRGPYNLACTQTSCYFSAKIRICHGSQLFYHFYFSAALLYLFEPKRGENVCGRNFYGSTKLRNFWILLEKGFYDSRIL